MTRTCVQNLAQVLVFPPRPRGAAVAFSWRLRNFLELGPALDEAVRLMTARAVQR